MTAEVKNRLIKIPKGNQSYFIFAQLDGTKYSYNKLKENIQRRGN